MITTLIALYILSIATIVMTLVIIEDRRPGNWSRVIDVAKMMPRTAVLGIVLNVIFAPFVALNCILWMLKGCKC